MSAVKSLLFGTSRSWEAFVIRLVLAIVIFPHGAQKLFGWFGGFGFEGTMGFLTGTAGLPWIAAFLVIMIESIGSVLIFFGVATRLVALASGLLAFGIMTFAHVQHGFFMNWLGNQGGEGIQFFLLWMGIALALVFAGGGKFSVDAALSKRRRRR